MSRLPVLRAHRSSWRAFVAFLSLSVIFAVAPMMRSSAAGGPNLAAGKATSASSTNAPYVAANLVDGDADSYWESVGLAATQYAQLDLGSVTAIDQVVLKLPAGWSARTEKLSVQSSSDGGSFATAVTSASYTFAPGSANTVTIAVPATSTRYVRIAISANSGWQAAQLSEIAVRHVTSDVRFSNRLLISSAHRSRWRRTTRSCRLRSPVTRC